MKTRIFKNCIIVLLIFSMSVFPIEKLQAESYTATFGNITYTIDIGKNIIIIEGEGTLGRLFSWDEKDPLEEQKELLATRCMHYVIGEGITKLEEYFTKYASVKSIHLPKSLKEIEDNAFTRCRHLESIVIPEGVEKIGKTALDDCQRLKTVTNYSSAEVYLPNHSDIYSDDSNDRIPYDYSGRPYDFYVDGKISTTVPPGKTAIGKAKQCKAKLHSAGGTIIQNNSQRYVYYRYGEPLPLPTVTRKGYIFCGWTTKEQSNYAWRTITNEDTGDPYSSTMYWYRNKDLYAQFAKIDTKKLGKRKLKLSISKWIDANKLEIHYSTNKYFKNYKSIIVKSSQLMKIWEFGKENKEKHYKLNYSRKMKMLSITLSKLKKNKKYYFRFQYSGLNFAWSEIFIYSTGDWFKKSVKM